MSFDSQVKKRDHDKHNGAKDSGTFLIEEASTNPIPDDIEGARCQAQSNEYLTVHKENHKCRHVGAHSGKEPARYDGRMRWKSREEIGGDRDGATTASNGIHQTCDECERTHIEKFHNPPVIRKRAAR